MLKGASAALVSASFVLLEVSLVPYNQGSPLLAEVVGWMDAKGWRVHDVFDLTRHADGGFRRTCCSCARARRSTCSWRSFGAAAPC